MKKCVSRVSVARALAVVAAGALCAVLTACGGGGGGEPIDGSAGASSTAAPPYVPPATPSQVPPSLPPSTPRADPYAPVAGSEPRPDLLAPQPGSTAAVGNGSEGIYGSIAGDVALIGASGKLLRKSSGDWIIGSITTTGLNWVFNPETIQFMFSDPVTGSGTFSPLKSMDGTFSAGGRSSTPWGPLTYSVENALAVNQLSVQGSWQSDGAVGLSLAIDSQGKFTGTTNGYSVGNCAITGTLTQAEPSTSKNMFAVHIDVPNNSATQGQMACTLGTSPLDGLAAIVLTPAGTYVGNGYFRSIVMTVSSPQTAFTAVPDKVR
ncbi:hypothetical protein SAMN05444747_104217 [Variovorax sp. OV329]|nr:hypothetical protein SAMN05444747_104217 [Variovorax sp. OV329]